MPELTLSEDHRYSLDGRRLIGVTEALSILNGHWNVDPWYLARGGALHLASEFMDKGTLDEESVSLEIAGYLDAYRKFKTDTGFIVTEIEKKLFHPGYQYAGKLDRIGELNSFLAIVDLKTGQKNPVDELQGAAYLELAKANGFPVKKVFDLYLREDGTYSLVEIQKPKNLLPVFLAALTLTRWKENL